MITFETITRINRTIEDAFAYVSDPCNFPRWNSAVQTVRKTSAENGVGSTYVMERELPTGRVVNRLRVLATHAPHEFAIRTTAGPTPFLYRYRFSSNDDGTVVRLDAEVELSGAMAFVPWLARPAVKSGVDANLAALKRILEVGGR